VADVTIDISGDDGDLTVTNPIAFDLQLTGCGLCIDMTHEQGHAIYVALGQYFGPEGTQ